MCKALYKIYIFILFEYLSSVIYFNLSSYIVYLFTNSSECSFTLATDELLVTTIKKKNQFSM